MAMRFLGKESKDGGSPTLFDNGETYVLIGYCVTDPATLAQMNIPDGETCIEVPKALMRHLPEVAGG